jgi:hypothetical protein
MLQLPNRDCCRHIDCGFPLVDLPGRPGVRACVHMHGTGVVRKHERPRRRPGKRRAQRA